MSQLANASKQPSSAAIVTRLTVGALLIDLLAVVLAGMSIYQSLLQHRERAAITTQNLALVLEESISGTIDQIDTALLSVQDEVKRELAAGGINADLLNGFLAQQREHQPDILSLRATDAQGMVRYGAGVPARGGPDNSDREYFIRARDESPAGLIVTKPIFARLDKKWVVVLARRLSKPDGAFAGVVYVNVALAELGRTFSKIDVGPKGSVTLRDLDLGLVVRHPEPKSRESALGSKPSLEGQKPILAGLSSATVRVRNPLDNIMRTVSYRRMSGKPFYINVGVAEEDYLATWRKESAITSALVFLLFLGTVLSSWLIYRFWKRGAVAAETVLEQKDFLDTILDSEPECVKVIGPSGELLQMNRAGLAMLEVDSLQEAKVLGLRHFVLPEYRDAFLSLSRRVFSGEPGTLEFEVQGKKGTRRWLDTSATPLRSAAGKVTALVAVTRDVTERKKIEAELDGYRHQLENRVAEQTAALSVAKDAAEAANRAKTTFLANMSHELRTPLNGIMGMANLALRRATDPQVKDYLAKVMRASEHLAAVIGDLLDISRIESDRLGLNEKEFELNEVLVTLASLTEQAAKEKGLVFVRNIAPELEGLSLLGDSLRLSQILLNLTGNAIKFTTKGYIAVGVSVAEDTPADVLLRFEVSDTGIGISAEDQCRLFKAFEQVDGSMTRQFGGTGIGLALSKRLAEAMGGSIGVMKSEVGVGSTFWFTARIKKGSAAARETPVATATESAEAVLQRDYKDRRLLLVEDDQDNRELTLAQLKHVWPVIDIARDGAEAVELADKKQYDLILMDVRMPRMDGLEATQRIRKLPNGAHVPILAMTANVFPADRERCMSAGMNDFIPKAVNSEAPFAPILKWLARPDRQP